MCKHQLEHPADIWERGKTVLPWKQVSCSIRGGWGKVSTHSTGAKPGKCACTRQRDCNQPSKRRKLTTGPPALHCRQQVVGRSCCKHLCSALENNSPWLVPLSANSSLGIAERELRKGATGREKTQLLPVVNLYLQGQFYHKNCPQFWADQRTALKWPLRKAKPHLRGLPVQREKQNKTKKHPTAKFKRNLRLPQSLWFRICVHNLHFQWFQPLPRLKKKKRKPGHHIFCPQGGRKGPLWCKPFPF